MSVPVIDVSALVAAHAAAHTHADTDAESCSWSSPAVTAVADAIHAACVDTGFFYIIGHGVPVEFLGELEAVSREFFALPVEVKDEIRMSKGGLAWRGYFPVGAELTSGKPDMKEGIYLGEELPEDHPAVVARTPLHGRNLWPESPARLRDVVTTYMNTVTTVSHAVMAGIALSLDLPHDYFFSRYTSDPLKLFRIFNYPCDPTHTDASEERWGVGAHTDYGLLTILLQDACGGLQVKTKAGWIEAPPIAGSFVVNLGDMLQRMTRGLYKSTLHRVRNTAGRDRLSFPFFFDPGWSTRPAAIEDGKLAAIAEVADDADTRWDKASVHAFSGTYGDYILGKVGKVFPELRQEVL